MKYIIYLYILILIGCGQDPYSEGIKTNNPIFNEHIEYFKYLYRVDVNVPIILTDITDGHSVGICHAYTPNNHHNWIEIDSKYWLKLSYYGKQQLIFHELGHCVLGLNHDNTLMVVNNYTIPRSIMYPYHFGEMWYYKYYLNYYYQELRK